MNNPPTFEDALRIARGCHDYNSADDGTLREAFHGGISTVVRALEAAKENPQDSQCCALWWMGREVNDD